MYIYTNYEFDWFVSSLFSVSIVFFLLVQICIAIFAEEEDVCEHDNKRKLSPSNIIHLIIYSTWSFFFIAFVFVFLQVYKTNNFRQIFKPVTCFNPLVSKSRTSTSKIKAIPSTQTNSRSTSPSILYFRLPLCA